ncbi:MAG: hypothetical protein LRY43_01210 [Gammaproteobacteria bacterium]|nr:hypothetical protein [Gammaproteobacteria bacterium]
MFAKQEKKSMLTAKTELNELFTVTSAQFFYDYVLPVLRDLFELDCRENTVINGLLNGGFALSTVLEGWSKEVKKHIPTVDSFKSTSDSKLCALVRRDGKNPDRKLSQAMEALLEENSPQLEQLKEKFGVYFSLYRLCRQLSIYIEASNPNVEKTPVGSTKQRFREVGSVLTKAMGQVLDRDIKMDFLWIVIKHLTGIQPCSGSFLAHVQQHSVIDLVRKNAADYFAVLNRGENIAKTRNLLDNTTLSLFHVDQRDVAVEDNRTVLMDAIQIDEESETYVTYSLPEQVDSKLSPVYSSSEEDMSKQESVLVRKGSFYEPEQQEEKTEREVHKMIMILTAIKIE